MRLIGANVSVLLFQIRSQNLKNMEGTELDFLMTGNGGLNGMRLRSSTLLKMFKTNEYAF